MSCLLLYAASLATLSLVNPPCASQAAISSTVNVSRPHKQYQQISVGLFVASELLETLTRLTLKLLLPVNWWC